MEQQIRDMYQKRVERGEIKNMVSDMTINKHIGNIAIFDRIMMDSHIDDVSQMDWCEKSFDELNEIIKNMKSKTGGTASLSTQHSYISSLLVLIRCRHFDDFFEQQNFKDASLYIHKDGDFIKSLKEYKSGARNRDLEKAPNKEKIDELVSEYINNPSADLDMKLLLSIYMNHPFRLEVADLVYLEPRQYSMMKNRNELNGNYVVKSKGRRGRLFFSFSKYKTNGTYGVREIDIKDRKLKSLMYEKLIPMTPNTHESQLFENMNRNQLTKKIMGFFEKRGLQKITPTVMSKLILNDEFGSDEAQKIISKQKALAQERGHSVSTQQNNYVGGA